jgi:hypothetical protein
MDNRTEISGNQNVVIQGITGNSITIEINGEILEIKNELTSLKAILEKHQTQTFQSAQTIYNIGQINESNFDYLTGNKAFNEVLTKTIIIALVPFSENAKKFLEKANEKDPNWESIAFISDKAKEIISYSFVGLIGIQLRKLMAIGKEEASKRKQINYIENCILTMKRGMQLLCFSLISALWDIKKSTNLTLTNDQNKMLKHFFETEFEMDLMTYLRLLNQLLTIYKSHDMALPLAELNDFDLNLKEENEFFKSCCKLQILKERLDRQKISMLDCYDAENHLTVFLSVISFLARYKMISVKNIGYDEMRNSTPHYLHNYVSLGMDNKSNINSELVNYIEYPVTTDSVLIYKGHYMESINLFPFIIDYNALTIEGGTKICFYTCREIEDGSLNYSFLDDNKVGNIVFTNIHKPDLQINEIMKDVDKRIKFKLDMVFLQFDEAKKTILSENGTFDPL